MLKFGNFQKSRFFGFQREFFGFGQKNDTFQKILHLENVIFKLFGGPGGSPIVNARIMIILKGIFIFNSSIPRMNNAVQGYDQEQVTAPFIKILDI